MCAFHVHEQENKGQILETALSFAVRGVAERHHVHGHLPRCLSHFAHLILQPPLSPTLSLHTPCPAVCLSQEAAHPVSALLPPFLLVSESTVMMTESMVVI